LTAKLPPLLQEIADVVGLAAAMKLAEIKGGQRVFVPDAVDADHWLAQLIGTDKATALAFYFTHDGGVHLDIPKGELLRRAQRNDLIAKLIADGRSANDIAAAVDLTRRHIFRKKRQMKDGADNPQTDLFQKKAANDR
jgi:hypothetical protein